jgi:hypothetical protein
VLVEHRRGAFITGGFDGEHPHAPNSTAVALQVQKIARACPRARVDVRGAML